jgi:hypothetical protein
MKISPGLYLELESHLRAFLVSLNLSEDEVTEHYHARGLSLRRARWDLLHASKFDTRRLYAEGLKDSHIDTALRRILEQPRCKEAQS